MLTAVKGKSTQINNITKGVSYADLHSEAGILRLQAVSENIIRIRFTAGDSFNDHDKPGLLPLEAFESFASIEYASHDYYGNPKAVATVYSLQFSSKGTFDLIYRYEQFQNRQRFIVE